MAARSRRTRSLLWPAAADGNWRTMRPKWPPSSSRAGTYSAWASIRRRPNALLPMKINTTEAENCGLLRAARNQLALVWRWPGGRPQPRPAEAALGIGGGNQRYSAGRRRTGPGQRCQYRVFQFPPYVVSGGEGVPSEQHFNRRRTYRRTAWRWPGCWPTWESARRRRCCRDFRRRVGGAVRGLAGPQRRLQPGRPGRPRRGARPMGVFLRHPPAACAREPLDAGGGWAVRLTMSGSAGKNQNVMLAQHDMPVKNAQWYRISLKREPRAWAANPSRWPWPTRGSGAVIRVPVLHAQRNVADVPFSAAIAGDGRKGHAVPDLARQRRNALAGGRGGRSRAAADRGPMVARAVFGPTSELG